MVGEKKKGEKKRGWGRTQRILHPQAAADLPRSNLILCFIYLFIAFWWGESEQLLEETDDHPQAAARLFHKTPNVNVSHHHYSLF